MQMFVRDVRSALRQFASHPATTIVSVLSLAVGIGAVTTIFSLINAFLLRSPDVRESSRLFYAYESSADGTTFHSFSHPQYRDLRARARSLSGLAAFDVAPLSVSTGGDAELALGMLVSGNFFDIIGVAPARGRFFAADEDATPGSHPVAVASYPFWKEKLGGDSTVVGRTVHVNGTVFTIVGVAPEAMATVSPLSPSLWVPIMMGGVVRPDLRLDDRGYNTFQLVARLAPSVTAQRAEAELDGLAAQISDEQHDATRGVDLHPFALLPTDAMHGISIFMALLMTFAALILLVACGNVASMLLASAVHRRREIAIRLALGASRARVVRQMVTESVVLCIAGASGAVLLALWATRAMSAFKPPIGIPITIDIPLDLRVLGFSVLVAFVVGALVGIVPALRATGVSVAPALKENATQLAGRSRLRGALVVGQVAFTLLLLVGAGLVVRALGRAGQLEPGFDPRNVHLASTDLSMRRYDAANARVLLEQWRSRVAALPGVRGVAIARRAPLGLGRTTTSFTIDGRVVAPDRPADIEANYNVVSPEFFDVLRVPLLAGRTFGPVDVAGGPRVAIVSAALARRYFDGPERAVGRTFRTGDVVSTIVGVAADTKISSLAEEPQPVVYEALGQSLMRDVVLFARTDTRSDAIGGEMRAALRALDPELPLLQSIPFIEHIGVALLPQRIAAIVAATLGIAGLLLAAIGVYGIVAFSVTQRTREIGIRVAVGATPGAVVALVARQGLRLTLIGIVLGLAMALAASRLMSVFLLGVNPRDPLTFGAVAGLLGAVAIIASLIPARRAAGLDPLVALRTE